MFLRIYMWYVKQSDWVALLIAALISLPILRGITTENPKIIFGSILYGLAIIFSFMSYYYVQNLHLVENPPKD